MTDLEVLREMFKRAKIKCREETEPGGTHWRGWLEAMPKHTKPVTFWFRLDGSLGDIGTDD